MLKYDNLLLDSWTQIWDVNVFIRPLNYGSNVVHDAPLIEK